MAILLILMTALALPIANIQNARSLTKATADMAGTLEAARAYSMANNTYVWVGIAEANAAELESKVPQTDGIGRIALAVVASKDGTRNPAASNLTATSGLKQFENVHIGIFNGGTSVPAGEGAMRRPGIFDNNYVLGAVPASTPYFSWPMTGAPKYYFKQAINFAPSGVARLADSDDIGQYFEIGLQPTRGNVVNPQSNALYGNRAAIQVDCMTGAVHIYKP